MRGSDSCKEEVPHFSGFGWSGCSRKQSKGSEYCWQHKPEVVAKRKAGVDERDSLRFKESMRPHREREEAIGLLVRCAAYLSVNEDPQPGKLQKEIIAFLARAK